MLLVLDVQYAWQCNSCLIFIPPLPSNKIASTTAAALLRAFAMALCGTTRPTATATMCLAELECQAASAATALAIHPIAASPTLATTLPLHSSCLRVVKCCALWWCAAHLRALFCLLFAHLRALFCLFVLFSSFSVHFCMWCALCFILGAYCASEAFYCACALMNEIKYPCSVSNIVLFINMIFHAEVLYACRYTV